MSKNLLSYAFTSLNPFLKDEIYSSRSKTLEGKNLEAKNSRKTSYSLPRDFLSSSLIFSPRGWNTSRHFCNYRGYLALEKTPSRFQVLEGVLQPRGKSKKSSSFFSPRVNNYTKNNNWLKFGWTIKDWKHLDLMI